MKKCNICNTLKPKTEFSKNIRKKDNLQNYCRVCLNKSAKEWRLKNPKRFSEVTRRNYYKTKYGITLENYDYMLKLQKGVCAICNSPNFTTTKKLAVDHCHSTGRIRSLLCSSCNVTLGLVKENKSILLNMIDYLDKWV